LQTLANVGEDSDPSGMTMASTDGIHAAVGNSNNSNDCVGNGHDGTFATAVQTHMSRMGSSSGSGGSSGNSGGNNFHINPNINIGSQKSSISRNIKIDDLRSYFHLPIVEVAKQLGICTTLLKRVCRTNKIKKWPYRQIRSIAKSIQSLEMASMNGLLAEAERDKSHEQITFLKRSLEALIDDPSIPSK
jgi:RWP-RK domain